MGMKKRHLVIVALLASMMLTSCSHSSEDVTTTTELIEEESEIKETETETEEETESIKIPEEDSTLKWIGKREASGKDILRNETGRRKNYYELNVDFDEGAESFIIDQNLFYVNDSDDVLNEMYFNIIPNAYSTGYNYEKADGSASDTSKDMTCVNSIIIGDKECKFKRVKGTVYSLALPEGLKSNDTLKINMKYTVKVPHIQNRFGYYNGEYNVGNFIITPAVYENGEWACNPYVEVGDAFYTEIADYKVKLNIPEEYKVAATGILEDGTYYAKDVRDFAFFISKKCEVITDTYDDIEIAVYYPKKFAEGAEEALKCAKKSFETFGELFGGYPYDDFDITMTAQSAGVGGMEYPGLIMVSSDPLDLEFAKTDKRYYLGQIDEIVCHEIAHQWFYGIVGNDEVNEPWLDESYANFSEKLFFYKSGKKNYDMGKVIDGYMQLFYHEKKHEDKSEFVSNIYEYLNDESLHYMAIYLKGGKFHYEMFEKLGEDNYLKGLKEYVKTFAFDEVTTDEFVDYWSEKGDFTKLFKEYLYGNAKVDAMK